MQYSRLKKKLQKTNAMTLIEIMVATALFSLMAAGVLASFLQVRKISEANVYEVCAQTMAQSVMEQVIRVSPTTLSDTTQTSLTIKLPTLTSDNRTSLSDFSLTWNADDTTYTDIGNSPSGVLIDANYRDSSANTLRVSKYMKMRVNIRRTIEDTENRIRVVIRYQWAVPDRKRADGSLIYLSKEMRTVRSTALRI